MGRVITFNLCVALACGTHLFGTEHTLGVDFVNDIMKETHVRPGPVPTHETRVNPNSRHNFSFPKEKTCIHPGSFTHSRGPISAKFAGYETLAVDAKPIGPDSRDPWMLPEFTRGDSEEISLPDNASDASNSVIRFLVDDTTESPSECETRSQNS